MKNIEKKLNAHELITKWNQSSFDEKVAMLEGYVGPSFAVVCWWNELPVQAQNFLLSTKTVVRG